MYSRFIFVQFCSFNSHLISRVNYNTVLAYGQQWFKEVEDLFSNCKVVRCQSVLEQDTEPSTTPAVQVGTLHSSLRHRCVNVDVKRFEYSMSRTAQYKCIPC